MSDDVLISGMAVGRMAVAQMVAVRREVHADVHLEWLLLPSAHRAVGRHHLGLRLLHARLRLDRLHLRDVQTKTHRAQPSEGVTHRGGEGSGGEGGGGEGGREGGDDEGSGSEAGRRDGRGGLGGGAISGGGEGGGGERAGRVAVMRMPAGRVAVRADVPKVGEERAVATAGKGIGRGWWRRTGWW